MASADVIDFYIFVFQFASIEREQWMICAKPASHCLAVHEDLASAIVHAREMAQYRVVAGSDAQIHVKERGEAVWKTVWCSAGSGAKYP